MALREPRLAVRRHRKVVVVLAVSIALALSGLGTESASASTRSMLALSWNSDRSNAVRLDGSTVKGQIYVFVKDSETLDKVDFYLDGRWRRESPVRTDTEPPFDFAGTAADGTAVPYDTKRLADGSHGIKVVLTWSDGTTSSRRANFTIANGGTTGPTTAPTAPTTTAPPTTSAPTATANRADTNASQGSAVPSSDPNAPYTAPAPAGKLSWPPPVLSSPTTVTIQDTGQACPGVTSPGQLPGQPFICYLDTNKDYIIRMNRRTGQGGLELSGGRNIILIGGAVSPGFERTCCDRTDEWKSRGLTFKDQTGTVHVEGVQINDATDGITLKAPDAIFQFQNINIHNLHMYRDDDALAHADIIQIFNGPREIRVDRLTGDSDYTGLSWFRGSETARFPLKVTLRRVNIFGNLQPNTLVRWPDGSVKDKPNLNPFTYMGTATLHSCDDCWVTTGWYSPTYQRKLQDTAVLVDENDTVVPSPSFRVTGFDGQTTTSGRADVTSDIGRRQGDYIEFLNRPNVANVRWHFGKPVISGAQTDFVPHSSVGTGYVSPGYL
jgi:hypothetical protein